MAQSWPTGIPNTIQTSGYSRELQDGVIRTDMETGPAKFRRRFTATQDKNRGQIIMTQAQYLTFETWFKTIIMYGALSFEFPDPLNNSNTLEVRFSKPPSLSPAGNGVDVAVTVEIEEVPA